MRAGDYQRLALVDGQAERPRAPRNAKAAPHLGGVRAVDLDGAVRRGATFEQSNRPGAVFGRAPVDDEAPPSNRELERQRIGVRMAGKVIRPDRRDVE